MHKVSIIAALLLAFLIPMFLLTAQVHAQTSNLDVWRGADNRLEDIGFKRETDPQQVAVAGINIMMGFLGLIAVIIVLMGGFKWMTAAGNEDKVAEAKKILMSGVIGLFIIMASYGLATWLIKSIVGVI